MAEIRAIEFSTAPLQMMGALADDLAAQRQAERKVLHDEAEKKATYLRAISPQVLNKDFDGQVVNSTIAQLHKSVKDWMAANPNASSTQLQYMLDDEIGKISTWSNNVKTIRSGVDEYFKNLPQSNLYNKANWQNATLTKALFKDDGHGNKVLRDVADLDPAQIQRYVDDTFNEIGGALVDGTEAEKGINEAASKWATQLKAIGESQGATVTKEGTSVREKVEIPRYMVWDDKQKKAVIRKGKDGYIADDVYDQFVGTEGINAKAYNKYIESQAKKAVSSGDPSYQRFNAATGKMELVDEKTAKKIWLGNRLEKNAKEVYSEVITQTPPKSETVINNYQGGTKDNKPSAGQVWYGNLKTAFKDGDMEKARSLISRLQAGAAADKGVQGIEFTPGRFPKIKINWVETDNRDLVDDPDRPGKKLVNPNKGKTMVVPKEYSTKDPDFYSKVGGAYLRLMGNDEKFQSQLLNE